MPLRVLWRVQDDHQAQFQLFFEVSKYELPLYYFQFLKCSLCLFRIFLQAVLGLALFQVELVE